MKLSSNIKRLPLFIFGILLISSQVALTSCSKTGTQSRKAKTFVYHNIPVINEAFQTARDVSRDLDSPAVWNGPKGQHWIITTGKVSNSLMVYNAANGSTIEEIGQTGTGKVEFNRPNGISVIDNLVFVVERDNHRVQVLRLPDFKFLGFLGLKGDDPLIYPYGITVNRIAANTYDVFVTDNYNPYLQGYPAKAELDERVHEYHVKVKGDSLKTKIVNIFGDTYDKGALQKVESIYADPAYNRLLIADEAPNNIKVYNFQGQFTGKIIPSKYFGSGDPEGISLYKCDDGSGYWIFTDQYESNKNKYLIFDRKTLDYIGAFKGKVTRATDGIWLDQKSFGPFKNGALYLLNYNGSVTTISWTDIANTLSLKTSCTR